MDDSMREAGRFMAGVFNSIAQDTEGHTATCMDSAGCEECAYNAAANEALRRWDAVDPWADRADSETMELGACVVWGEVDWAEAGPALRPDHVWPRMTGGS
jgi:hypothetical protein